MKKRMPTHIKYDRHESEWDSCLFDSNKRAVADSWFETDTLDHWRHDRMRAPVAALIQDEPAATWLTVGDGRFGTDGNALMRMGAQEVHCSDISDKLLMVGSQKGFINAYSIQNAEDLAFDDESFDYIYCKESFHHFPRPFLALYEMFRVARRAVILTEPRDLVIDTGVLQPVFKFLKWIIRKSSSGHAFEPVGNYLYRLSEREMEKFLLGMHYNLIGFHEVNDAYEAGVEFVKLGSNSASDRWLRLKLKSMIILQDVLCLLGLRKTGLLTVALFKSVPAASLLESMRNSGWRIRELPSNPFLERSQPVKTQSRALE